MIYLIGFVELGDGCLQGWMVAMKAGFVSLRYYFETRRDSRLWVRWFWQD